MDIIKKLESEIEYYRQCLVKGTYKAEWADGHTEDIPLCPESKLNFCGIINGLEKAVAIVKEGI